MPDFRQIIRTALTNRSLYWLAKDSGVPYSCVHEFLSGGKEITSDNLQKIAKSLGLSLRLTFPRLTDLEKKILQHRLNAPDAIGDALSEDGFDDDQLSDVIDHLANDRFDAAMSISREITFAVLKDAVDGSVYFGSARSQSEQAKTAIYRAGTSLARKVSALIGQEVVFPDH